MIGTVDLVIAGNRSAARAPAISALERGLRVLVVLRSADARAARRFRRSLLDTAGADRDQLGIMTRAEVVCADGIDGVEAVVVRHTPTGRLSAVNASAFLPCDGQKSEYDAPLPSVHRDPTEDLRADRHFRQETARIRQTSSEPSRYIGNIETRTSRM